MEFGFKYLARFRSEDVESQKEIQLRIPNVKGAFTKTKNLFFVLNIPNKLKIVSGDRPTMYFVYIMHPKWEFVDSVTNSALNVIDMIIK